MLSRKLVKFGGNVLVRCCSNDVKNGIVTALHQLHIENGGKMVNFAGYLLPVQYNNNSIVNSHLHTRQNASLFDVSHMLQTELTGSHCVEFFETLCTADIKAMANDTSTLTVFTNDHGGILDDLIVTKINHDHLYIVSNAARKEIDRKHMLTALNNLKMIKKSTDITIRFFEPLERSLLALQGPSAAQVLQKITDVDLSKLYFMNSTIASIANVGACRITRCGYTGEDGFEISVPSIKAQDVAKEILNSSEVKLAGLGARDSLRLEAGLCLYGSDIIESTTPVEANLTWLVAKRRRETLDFPGADIIVNQIKNGVLKKRVGLILESGPPARHDTVIYDENGSEEIGVVTSGCPGPSIGKNVAMGYVAAEYSKIGTSLKLNIRNKIYNAIVTKMPFVQANYYNKPKL